MQMNERNGTIQCDWKMSGRSILEEGSSQLKLVREGGEEGERDSERAGEVDEVGRIIDPTHVCWQERGRRRKKKNWLG